MNREQFLALLARLRGEGDPITLDELRQLVEYVNANAGDRAALEDGELVEVEAAMVALADDEDLTLEGLEAAADLADGVRNAAASRIEADETAAAEEAERARVEAERREELRRRLAPVAEGDGGEGDGEGDGEGAGDGATTTEPGDGGEPEPEPEGADDGAREPVAATAAASRPAPGQLRHRRPAGQPQPRQTRQRNRIVRDGGGEYADIAELGQAMVDRRLSFLSANGGISEKTVIGSIVAEYPDERVLDPMRADSQIQAVVSALQNVPGEQFDAVTASGGLCAPAEPYYGYMQLAEADRPVRASLQQFNAGRGRITFRTPPDFPDFASAVEIWTEENDSAPGSDGPSTKPCLVVPCPDTDDAVIYAVTECLQFGNFLARTDPETVQNAVQNTMAAFARKAETKLLDLMKAASTAVTAGDALGAYRDLSYQIRVAAAGYRSRHRMRRDAVLEVRLPSWVYDLVLADLVRSLPGDGTLTAGEDLFNRALAAANVRLAGLYLDSPTSGVPQVFGPQNATGLVDFPSAVQWQISAPGSFLLLDNGRLDLGVVRDSTLNSTNDYQTFAETFEGLAYVGLESNWVTSTVCPNGASSGTVDPSAFCSGDYVPA